MICKSNRTEGFKVTTINIVKCGPGTRVDTLLSTNSFKQDPYSLSEVFSQTGHRHIEESRQKQCKARHKSEGGLRPSKGFVGGLSRSSSSSLRVHVETSRKKPLRLDSQ